jgi:rod shape-determining protein MreB
MPLFSKTLSVDIGTSYTRIAANGKLLLEEPSVVAVEIDAQKMVAIGNEAANMIGRVSEDVIEVTRPVQHGVVAYYMYTRLLLQELLRKVIGPMRFNRPRLILSYPHGATSVERRAVQEAALEVSGDAVLIPQPIAAALGVELPIGTPTGNMIVLFGGGSTQATVIAMHDVVAGKTLREGGLEIDEAIMAYVRKKYGLIIAQPTAEMVKIEIGAAVPQDEEKFVELQGQDQVTGLPRPFTLTTSEVVEAVQKPLSKVVETVRNVLEMTPPELASDIIDRGIALAGGAALLRGLDRYMTQQLGVPAYLVENPVTCVIMGTERSDKVLPLINRGNTIY